MYFLGAELLLVMWGLLFITIRTEKPWVKGRDLKMSMSRGMQRGQSVALSLYTSAWRTPDVSEVEGTSASDLEARRGQVGFVTL